VCAAHSEEPEKPTKAVAMSTDSADDELNIDAVVEERRLEAHNEAEDDRCLLLGPATSEAADFVLVCRV
jgi:hypothetical protein